MKSGYFPQKTQEKFTCTDYLTWPDDERWELIDGVPYNMTPAPSFRHQRIVGRFYSRLERALAGRPCIPVISPTDVVLSEYDVVQPDIFVVCDEKKVTEKNIQGAPDVIIEVLSPSTTLKDRREKKILYERCRVREYILIDPVAQYVERFSLGAEGTYRKSDLFGPQELLPLTALEGIHIPLWEVFEVEGPKAEKTE